MKSRRPKFDILCPSCHRSLDVLPEDPDPSQPQTARCISCAATITIDRAGAQTLHVQGTDANDVRQVSGHLAQQLADQRSRNTSRNPWLSGSFYLVAMVSLIVLLLVVARQLSALTFPLVLIGGLLGVSILGALQLRNDSKLSQKSFLQLMLLTFQQLPFVGKSQDTRSDQGKGTA